MDCQVTTRGLEELGIELKAPYGAQSFQHALLINNGPHRLLACEVVFEITTEDGEVLSVRKNFYSGSFLEKDPAKKKVVLDQEEKITPRSKWLLGFSDPYPESVGASLPVLTPERSDPEVFHGVKKCRKFSIRLTGVITEDGKAHGPEVRDFLKHMEEDVRELSEER